ncbi:polyphosphate--glucose phosphotransferase [Leucobacter sp. M11]|uniref:polyphosphate--glucose phosphotransferase n=1 Tax=Leucobacter sp. M11 TaxID=2993565 RepID=UPI002D7FADFE|nr:ROK family protein [Leucobacter sp. M11]MEB4615482.1 ROK family protein [Leucobacter sp. M11]
MNQPAARTQRVAIGIDVGGTGIKGGALDLASGELLTPRVKRPTPAGGAPAAIADTVADILARVRGELAESNAGLAESSPVGVCLPAVVRQGVTLSAANIDPGWIGLDARALLTERLGAPVAVLNDADAAGVAEARLGAAAGLPGTTIVTTFGTGIGSALLHDGVLFPNAELGHLDLPGYPDIERFASGKAVSRDGLSFRVWAEHLSRFFGKLEVLFSPDRFVFGGGISREADAFLPLVAVDTPILVARFRNSAGLIGAALAARDRPAASAG